MKCIVACMVTLISVVAIPSQIARAQAAPPQFVNSHCGFQVRTGYTVGKNLRCGDLLVPQDPTVLTTPSLHLRVAIFRTPSSNRQPDPVVFLQGGPGGSIVQLLGRTLTPKNVGIIGGNHDLILIDQRGTGLSRPGLTCPEVSRAGVSIAHQRLHRSQVLKVERAAEVACRSRLVAHGVDPAAYTTLRDAADIADLRTALNYPAIDIYAVSYGTRVALDIMRYYPTGIRSVVLDSIVTPQFNVYTDAIAAEGRAFDALFTGCARIRHCRAKFPFLKTVFTQELAALNQTPLRVGNTEVNGYSFAELVRSSMYSASLLKFIPRLMQQVNHRNTRLLRAFLSGSGSGNSGISIGVYESVQCTEDAPRATPADIVAAANTLPAPIRRQAVKTQRTELSLCQVWQPSPVDAGAHDPVVSSIPTMLMGGEYDPITPPQNVSIAGATLSHSFGFVYPGVGHGSKLSKLCPNKMANAFFDNPDQSPSNACMTHMVEPFRYS